MFSISLFPWGKFSLKLPWYSGYVGRMLPIVCCGDSLAHKGIYYQAWRPELDLKNPLGRRSDLIHMFSSDTPMHALEHMHLPQNKWIWKKAFNNQQINWILRYYSWPWLRGLHRCRTFSWLKEKFKVPLGDWKKKYVSKTCTCQLWKTAWARGLNFSWNLLFLFS